MSMVPEGIEPPPGAFKPVTRRPQAATTIAITSTANPSRRSTDASLAVRIIAVTTICAFALHAAFPKFGLVWLAPLALAGLFALWSELPPRAAAAAGYAAGIIFFALDFAWFGETAGKLLGSFGFILDLGPAIVEALAFALTAFVVSIAARRCAPWLAVLVGAATFTAAEWARSSGLLGVPMYQIGAPLIETPLVPLAAAGGVYLLTFAGALFGAALGSALREQTWREAAAYGAIIVAATALAWWTWPARTLAPGPAFTVAAVQGNITQDLKWTQPALDLAVTRYTAMTEALRPAHPRFVLWPETVITTDLGADPALQARFAALAHALDTTLAVGSVTTSGGERNVLAFYLPSGVLHTAVAYYAKRQLVPFAEFLPGSTWLRALPFAGLASDFARGTGSPVIRVSGLAVAPLICWESAFGDLAQSAAADGAQFYAVATDDAWFGTSDGPYAHAQLTTVRAVETGRWIVRAAATGISGIVGPDGRWRERTALETQASVVGTIGPPQPGIYARLGPLPFGFAFTLIAIAGLAAGGRRP
jgi:apolipoprotein N-acyltransferase